jgi:hypothetical protein
LPTSQRDDVAGRRRAFLPRVATVGILCGFHASRASPLFSSTTTPTTATTQGATPMASAPCNQCHQKLTSPYIQSLACSAAWLLGCSAA